jgi:hypothetical protein
LDSLRAENDSIEQQLKKLSDARARGWRIKVSVAAGNTKQVLGSFATH